jgi:hypothetical protein
LGGAVSGSAPKDGQAEAVVDLSEPGTLETLGESAALLAGPSGSRFVVREYAYRAFRGGPTGKLPASGPKPASKSPQFDLPEQPGVFRIRADLLAPEGHMHLAETKIVSGALPAKPSSVPAKPPSKEQP